MIKLLKTFWKNEDGFFPLFSAFGGLAVAKTLYDVVGGVVKNRIAASEDRRNARLDYEQQRKLGFTHSEIAGSGGAGASSANVSVMGNQHNQMLAQQRELAFQHLQKELDRAVVMRGQDAGIQSANISAGASMYNANLVDKYNRDTLSARMGPENMLATAIAKRYGVDLSNPDQKIPSDVMNAMIRDVLSLSSGTRRNLAGIFDTVGKDIPTTWQQFENWLSNVGVGPSYQPSGNQSPTMGNSQPLKLTIP